MNVDHADARDVEKSTDSIDIDGSYFIVLNLKAGDITLDDACIFPVIALLPSFRFERIF